MNCKDLKKRIEKLEDKVTSSYVTKGHLIEFMQGMRRELQLITTHQENEQNKFPMPPIKKDG